MILTVPAQYTQETLIQYYKDVQTPLYVGLDSSAYTLETEKYLDSVKPSGIVLRGNNIRDYTQTKQLIADIHNYAKKRGITIKVSVDEEGGLVSRFRNVDKYPADFTGLTTYNEASAGKQAKYLSDIGIDVNLAPVVDIAYKPTSALILRSAGNTPNKVSEVSTNYLAILKSNRVEGTLKHFPGLGRTEVDTHLLKANVDITKDEWLKTDAIPYIRGIEVGVENIMLAHVLYPKIDSSYATASEGWVQILREELGFKGKIMTDDLKMLGIEQEGDSVICNNIKVGDNYNRHSILIKKSLQAGVNNPLIILLQQETIKTVENWLAIEKVCT
jgi:beta-N-acetylhexosaminidase